MELEEFVKKTLLQITDGVASAQEESKLFIAPGSIEGQKLVGAQMVSFDVSVTTGKEAGGGIRIFSFGEAKGGVSSEAVNRIAFQVPVYFQAPTEKHQARKRVVQGGRGGGGGDFDTDVVQAPKEDWG